MRIRKHSRITALILALVMILPLISIPTFAEDTVAPTPFNWSEDFDDATSIDDVTASGVNDRTLVDGALKIPLQGYDDGSVYVRKNKSGSYIKATGNATDGYVATVDGTAYTLKGTVNNTALAGWVAATEVSPAPPAGTTLYLACAAAADLYDGFKGNIAKNTYFKHGAISADYDMVTYTANYFVSSDFHSGSSLKFYNFNGLKYAQATVDSVNVSFKNHGDIGDGNTSLKEIKVQKGQWFELKVVFDRVSGRFTLYVDGQLCNVNSSQAAKVQADFAANSLGVFEFARNINDPSAKGYVLIDNVSVTTEGNGHFGTIDFENMKDITAFSKYNSANTGVEAQGLGRNFDAPAPTSLTAATENGNTFLKHGFDMEEVLKAEPYYQAVGGNNDEDDNGVVDVYVWSGSTRWEKNAQIKSYNKDTGVLTLTDDTTITATPNAANSIAVGDYATFVEGSTTYRITSPAYAVKNEGTFKNANGVMNKNVAIRLPYVTYAEYEKVVLSAKHYIAPGSYGKSQSQLFYITKNGTGATYQGFYYIVMRGTDAYIPEVTGLNGTVYLPMGDWFDLDIVINLKNGACEFYVDNVYVGNLTTALGTNIEFERGNAGFGGSSWILGKMYDGENMNLTGKGYIGYDDVSLRPVSTMAQTYLAKEDFDSPYALDKEPKYAASGIPNISSVAVADSVVTDEVGSPAWKIDFDRTNTTVDGHSQGYNANKNNLVKHPASSVLKGDTVVFEASYFIDSNARGQIQSQLMKITVDPTIPDLNGSGQYQYEDGKSGTDFKRKNNASWADLYVIRFYQNASNSEIVLTREGGTRYNPNASAPLRAEVWNTITVVLTRSTGMVKYYVNGEFAFEDQLNSAAGADVSLTKNNEAYKNVGFAANQWVIGKVNHLGTSGTFYIDNVKMYEGDAPTVTPEVDTNPVYDFEEFKYVNDGDSAVFGGFTSAPQLLTFKKEANGNTALRLDMGSYMSHSKWALYKSDARSVRAWDVAYTNGATQLTYVEANYDILEDEANGLPYIVIDNEKNYIIPADVAETAAGYSRGNVTVATSFAHDTFSYETTPTVVFAADYLIEEGSTGIIESQFANATGVKKDETERSTTGFLQLFHLYANGLIDGQGGVNYGYKVKVGEWINIKVVANLVTGVFNIYADGICVRTYDCGYTNLILDQDWSFAKVQRHTDPNGGIFEGGILIDNVSIGVEEFEHSESYGDKFLTDEVFEGYTADLITIVESASIRFKVPCGLRFASVVNTQKLNHLKGLFPEADVKMGTFIAPIDYITTEEGLDTYEELTRADFDGLDAYLDVEFGGEYFRGDAGVTLEGGKSYMTGSIVGIKLSNYDRDFAAVGYIEFEVDGQVIGARYTDAVIRNVQEVAETVLDEASDLTSEQEDILYYYLDLEELPEEYMPEAQ